MQRTIVRKRADGDLAQEPLVPEDLVLEEDLLDHLLWAAGEERSARSAERVELRSADRSPTSLTADRVHHRRVRGEELIRCPLGAVGDVRVGVDAERRGWFVPGLESRTAVKIGERCEAFGLSADDRKGIGSPSFPARIADSGVPPTASHIGSGS